MKPWKFWVIVPVVVFAPNCLNNYDFSHRSDAGPGEDAGFGGGTGGSTTGGSGGGAGTAGNAAGGSGGTGGVMCGPGEKTCNGKPDKCEDVVDPGLGCGDLECEPCVVARGTPGCDDQQQCSIASCDVGWASCDGKYSTDCETEVSTVDRCGGCNTVCPKGVGAPLLAPFQCEEALCQCDPGYVTAGNNDTCRTDYRAEAKCNDQDLCLCGRFDQKCGRGEYCGYFTQFLILPDTRCVCNGQDYGCRDQFRCVNNSKCSCEGDSSCMIGAAPLDPGQVQCSADGRCVCNGTVCSEGHVCRATGGGAGASDEAVCACGELDHGCDRSDTEGPWQCAHGTCKCVRDSSCSSAASPSTPFVGCFTVGDNAGRCFCGANVCGPGEHCRSVLGGVLECVCGAGGSCSGDQVCRKGSDETWSCGVP